MTCGLLALGWALLSVLVTWLVSRWFRYQRGTGEDG